MDLFAQAVIKVLIIIAFCVMLDLVTEELSSRPLSPTTHIEQYMERVCFIEEQPAFCAEAKRALEAEVEERE
jgi:hypothetical protein